MKYLIAVFLTGATITVAITTALAAQSRGLTFHSLWTPPYVYGYGAAGVLLILAIATAIHAGMQESNKTADEKHKDIKSRLASLLMREREVYAALKAAPDNADYTNAIRKADDWINEVATLLEDADEPTDAETFRQIGHVELSFEYQARFAHIPQWKRGVVARQLLYRQTLDQIKSNRRF
jgi:hypothetical protein